MTRLFAVLLLLWLMPVQADSLYREMCVQVTTNAAKILYNKQQTGDSEDVQREFLTTALSQLPDSPFDKNLWFQLLHAMYHDGNVEQAVTDLIEECIRVKAEQA